MNPEDFKTRHYILKCRGFFFFFFKFCILKLVHTFKFWGFGKGWDRELGTFTQRHDSAVTKVQCQ